MTEESGEEFVARCGKLVTDGISSMSFLIGKHLGLFDVLADLNGVPATSQEIADKAGYKERYVREWLNAMAPLKMVNIDDEGKRYWVPPSRAAAIKTRDFNINTLWGSFLPMFGSVYFDIQGCFKKTGPRGLPYEKYDVFQDAMGKFTSEVFVDTMIPKLSPFFPDDIKQKFESGLEFLDVACGTGLTTLLWAEAYPNSKFTGFDFSASAIQIAEENAKKKNIHNIMFADCDATKMKPDWSDKFDVVCIIDSLHDMARPDLCLKEMYRVMKKGGIFLLIDIDSSSNPAKNQDNPINTVLYSASLFHCMPVSLAFEDGMGLGTCWGRELAQSMMTDAGFEVIHSGTDIGFPVLDMFARKK